MKSIGLATLGKDVEVRKTSGGDSVASLNLAVSYYDKNADRNRGTQWIEAALWGDKRISALEQYLVKGARICVTLDDLHVETYTNRDGLEKSKLVAKVADIELAGSSQQYQQPAPRQSQPAQRQQAQKSPAAEFDDDIPF